MIGGRTHRYPEGRPLPLLLIDLGMVIIGVMWLFLVPGHWPRAIPVMAALFVMAFISTTLHKRYERSGQAVRIPRPKTVTKFPKGLPGLVLIARIAFFATVAIMLGLGLAPVPVSTARVGIVACVLALFGVAILNLALERHYVTTGRATEIDASADSKAR